MGQENYSKKIHDFFIISEDYQDSLKNLNKEIIEIRAKKIRAKAEQILLPNKIWGAIVGIMPLADLALQKFVIKKNAMKKVGEIFGFDSEFIDEENRRESEEITIEDIAEGTSRVASSALSYTSVGIAIEEGAAESASLAGQSAAAAGTSTLLKFTGVGFLGIGCLIGVGVGGYTTYKFCEELLNKFENYYKNHPDMVRNSYLQATKYFSI